MSFLVWNCCGLGNPQTIRELMELVRAQHPTVMFIVETWLDEARLKFLLRNFDLEQKHVVSKVNYGGGLVLMWKSDFDISVTSSSLNHIDTVINAGKTNSCCFTSFYGCPETHRHHESWSQLKNLNLCSSLTWRCAGDFNEIVKSHEKLGGRARLERQMKEFCDALDECSFAELGYERPKFTWFKCLTGGITVWECLDRVVANPKWFTLFPGSSVRHLESVFSDHKPIIIHPDGIQARSRRPWRFEQVWLKDEMCRLTVESAWSPTIFSPFPMTVLEDNLVNCQSKLRLWSKTSFGNINRALIDLKLQVKKAEEEAAEGGNTNRLHMLKADLRDLLSSEEKLWQQREKLHWLKEGD